jgi:endonuclease/exonuclease/phosphatase family metal-dependent hydrolase
MKKFLCVCVMVACAVSAHAQTAADTGLRVVNWNVEWFGSTTFGPANKDLQEANVKKVLRYLNAHLYALEEVVDTMRLRRVTDSLGKNYSYVISDFTSLAATPQYANWITGQKLAFIYRNDMFSNVRVRGIMRNSSSAYSNFASGRFPFLFNANVNFNGRKRNISFLVLHAKAGATVSDYTRRYNAAVELKDTLDTYFKNHPTLLLGDFNDDFDRTIVNNAPSTLSSYDPIIKDSIGPLAYTAVTLPLSYARENSTISFSDVIDHQLANGRMDSMYIKQSAAIRKDITNVVPDYISAHNTSDHFPVSANYSIISGDTSVYVAPPPPPPPAPFVGLRLWPNPFNDQLFFQSGGGENNVQAVIYNVVGQRVWATTLNIPAQLIFNVSVPTLPQGIYILQLRGNVLNATIRLMKQ